eukprot:936693-Pelagomonas_calceolata.AAC.1
MSYLKVCKQHLVFPPPMGMRELHVFQQTQPVPGAFNGPLVVLLELQRQLFSGPGCLNPILSTVTLKKTIEGGVKSGHWHLCEDRATLRCLSRHNIINGHRVKSVVVLSLPCL